MTKKKEETEEVPENQTPKKTSPKGKSKEEKKTLLELVKSSKKSDTLIIMELSRNGYLTQFYTEEKRVLNGLEVEPTMTESEFKKIIGD